MRRLLTLATLTTLWACGQPRDFVGDNLGDASAAPDQTEVLGTPTLGGGMSSPSNYDLDGFMAGAPTCLAETDGETLDLVGFTGGIEVLHMGKPGLACGEWQVRAEIYEADQRIDIVYDEVGGETCDRNCAWMFDYDLDGLEAGDWTVNAGSQTATVTVQ